MFFRSCPALVLACLLVSTSLSAQQAGQGIGEESSPQSVRDGVYTLEQAQAGAALYGDVCAECHGVGLRGGEAGPALVGSLFWRRWEGQPLSSLYQITRVTMPVSNPDGLSGGQYRDLLAFILQQNGLPSGENELPAEVNAMVSITLRPGQGDIAVQPLTVSDSLAEREINAEWLSYHGSSDSSRYSPLDQINRDNVAQLEIAWRWYAA